MMRCVLPSEQNRLTIVVPDAKPLLALSRQSALDALLALRRTELWVSDIAEAGNVMDVMEPMEVREADGNSGTGPRTGSDAIGHDFICSRPKPVDGVRIGWQQMTWRGSCGGAQAALRT